MTSAQGSSAENPFPVRAVATRVAAWIDKLGTVWVEGQLTQINLRSSTAYMVLRDPAANMSLDIICPRDLVAAAPVKLTEGTQVIVRGKPSFYTVRGSFSLRVNAIRAVGLGELLARIERLRRLLEAEGLFDPRLKRPLPFLPKAVGLISGRASAAQRDVVAVATARWSSVRFEIRDATVQGPAAVPSILPLLAELDAAEHVEVIIIARGGGSVEDLLPFSDETLLRAVSACRTPVISAIGHEPDSPLLDHVADVRAATPTDAAKRAVPDVSAELTAIAELRRRSAHALRNWVHREERGLAGLRARPVLARPLTMIDARADDITRMRSALRRDITRAVDGEQRRIEHLSARLSTLGPAQTLARGYAVVQRLDIDDPHAVSSVDDLPAGARIRIRVADGSAPAVIDTAAVEAKEEQ
ncbi:exodeoxyribonuclease VII large subunit [Gordonia sp. UBA7599]|uniref:exodeoxyribonuclease VII large subunit n=1 Tax=Gordonia sp. UBA7599 TaxID=1946578 RepID=UPI0025BE83D1|nr:exodeoxyribonuclease VII large subunit [Gordonia sp. UBA7599]